jgi:NAD(P)-dependent dehydrogenase (short-subunit alcohol dehydrogenase family)
VADEAQVLAFREDVLQRHASRHINLLFNNAGIGGGNSFVNDSRADWEKTFNVCWSGVYYCTRAFLPLLIASREACLVNVSSVNGFFAAAPDGPHSAYSTAKFAVKGFTEGLYTDLAINAPHVKVALVMPGHIGTSIVHSTMRSFGHRRPSELGEDDVSGLRSWLQPRVQVDLAKLSDEQVRHLAEARLNAFRDRAPLTPDEAATIILEGVRAERWRILVGADAQRLDQLVRNHPDQLYEPEFLAHIRAALEEERLKVLAKKRAEAPTG